jgi:PPK2 family polyphosphate:nucleotide phosphotransferase
MPRRAREVAMKTRFDEPGRKVRLKSLSEERAARRFDAVAKEIFQAQESMWGARMNAMLVVLQGRDGAGKDGAIKNVAGQLNPRGVSVTSFGVPTLEERQHDFLWRVHRHAPRLGEFAIFNRSHYEDVLVARVHELVPKKLWKRRFDHIADFETLLASHGTLIVKFFLHITREEQEKRLVERERDPLTAWKLNVEDWKERRHWDEYTEAYEDAISRTAAPHAPWIVVPANAKWYRNLVVAEAIAEALREPGKVWEKKLQDLARVGREELEAYRAGKRE